MTEGVKIENAASGSREQKELPRSFGRLWPFLRYSFLAAIILSVIYSLYELAEFQIYYGLQNGSITYDDAIGQVSRIDAIGLLITVPFIIVSIVSVVSYCRFYYRATKNLHSIGTAHITTSPFWASGYFFVPIINLWKPLGAVRQIWRASFDPVEADVKVPGYIGLWWFVWLVGNILDNISMRFVWKTNYDENMLPVDIDGYMGGIVFSLLATPFSIVAAVLVLKFTHRIVEAQQLNVFGNQ